MTGRVVRSCVIAVALVLAAATWAQAQAPSVNISFKFIAAGKVLDAGNYSVDVTSDGRVVLTPEKGGTAVEVPQIRTLSQRNVQRPELIFDRVGSAMFLAEVWVPGKGGFLVGRRSDAQEREKVTGPKVEK
jgi:hypothetical protein